MSNYRQNYQPPTRHPSVTIWLALLAALIGLMLTVNAEEEDAKRTAEAKLSAALDDAYQAGVRDALKGCAK